MNRKGSVSYLKLHLRDPRKLVHLLVEQEVRVDHGRVGLQLGEAWPPPPGDPSPPTPRPLPPRSLRVMGTGEGTALRNCYTNIVRSVLQCSARQWPQLYSTLHLWSKEEKVLLLSQHLGPPLSTLGILESETKDISF